MLSSTLHLYIAQKVAEAGFTALNGRYLLGSLTPDAVRTRPGATREDSEAAHLKETDWASAYNGAAALAAAVPGDAFLLGACVHVMADVLWLAGPYRRFMAKAAEGRTPAEVRALYARDLELMDRYCYRQPGMDNLWAAAMAAQPQSMEGVVTAAECDRWRKERFADLQNSTAPAAPELFAVSEGMTFAEEAAARIVQRLMGKEN